MNFFGRANELANDADQSTKNHKSPQIIKENTMEFLEANEMQNIDNHPRVQAARDRVRECEKQLKEAEEVLTQADLLVAREDLTDHVQSLRHQQVRAKAKDSVRLCADALQAARQDVNREIEEVLKVEARQVFEELIRDLEKVRREKHAEAQRLYNKAQRLLGGATNFPPLMFSAFSETSGQESRFTVWRDAIRRELE